MHLAVGACRQLQIVEPPVEALSAWLTACGQTLFDTPDNGERGWADQEAWITPPDRLALRYRLPRVFAGEPLASGLAPGIAQARSAGGTKLVAQPANELMAALDPAPGFERTLGRRSARADAWTIVESVMATPHYQLA